MRTLPAEMVAPRSPTTCPTKDIRTSMSMAGGLSWPVSGVVCCSLIWSVDIWVSLVSASGWMLVAGTLVRGVAAPLQRLSATALQPTRRGWSQGKRRGRTAMRAREPDEQGYVDRGGVRIAYESFGDGDITVLFPPVDVIVHSRVWKAQVPFLARHFRVVTIDPRGNGRSDRPSDTAAYGDLEYVGDTIAVMDHLGIDSAVMVGICYSAWPVLVFHGTDDRCQPVGRFDTVVRLTGAERIVIEGGSHLPMGRDPVVVNHAIKDFTDRVTGAPPPSVPVPRGAKAPPRVLYLSSPIGLGHVRRDLAIADALREQRPDVEVEWLTQSPVVEFLEQRGERVHPASAHLVSESTHFESESGEHDLHAFQAIRRMDEVLVANFMVFDDLVSREHFDLWVGDEAWDVDHFLHENPELKRSPFVWMTDFVGWVPMPDGGEREAFLTADYNAEMVEHVSRFPALRDRSVFVGDPEDVVDLPLGPDLPTARAWTEEHFDFTGYVMGERPAATDRAALRQRLGYSRSDVVCVVS